MYKAPANSPFIPNQQKEIMDQRNPPKPGFNPANPPLTQKGPRPGQQPIVDLQVYEPVKPAAPKPQVNPALFVPLNNTGVMYPPQWMVPGYPNMLPYSQVPNNVPILKNYNINVGGLNADHLKVSAIYEDILPNKQFLNTSNTCGERITMHQFARSVFVKHDDGEDIDLDGNSTNSLLRYLKFVELNPYNTNQLSDNPYKGLPDNMLIYRSCYPIRYDMGSNATQCAPNSVGMNIRIYKMTNGEYYLKKQGGNDYYKYNLWREIVFYEYIREKVIKTRQCPNFPIMYAYFICEKCGIDFNKLKGIKGSSVVPDPAYIAKNGQINAINQLLQADNDTNYAPISLRQQTGGAGPLQSVLQQRVEPTTSKINSNINPNMDAPNGKAAVILTEAPTYNLFGWATKTYSVEGNLNKMINTGYHNSEVWHSVLFQILAALYVMQIHKIAFKNFSVLDNIYIKDTKVHDNVTNFWKYRIDGIDYYVPNYGFLVMIDSNYKDIPNQYSVSKASQGGVQHKIYSSIFEQDGDPNNAGNQPLNPTFMRDMCFKQLVEAINPNIFSQSFTNGGGVKPPEDILTLMGVIHNESTNDANKEIGPYIAKYMRMFMNNRVGTLLIEDEVANIRDESVDFTKGQIVVETVQSGTFKFVLFLETNGPKATILTRNEIIRYNDRSDAEIVEKQVPRDSLRSYSKYMPIDQTYKPEALMNEDKLLETYIINKL
jgi:hypothetical protein